MTQEELHKLNKEELLSLLNKELGEVTSIFNEWRERDSEWERNDLDTIEPSLDEFRSSVCSILTSYNLRYGMFYSF